MRSIDNDQKNLYLAIGKWGQVNLWLCFHLASGIEKLNQLCKICISYLSGITNWDITTYHFVSPVVSVVYMYYELYSQWAILESLNYADLAQWLQSHATDRFPDHV